MGISISSLPPPRAATQTADVAVSNPGIGTKSASPAPLQAPEIPSSHAAAAEQNRGLEKPLVKSKPGKQSTVAWSKIPRDLRSFTGTREDVVSKLEGMQANASELLPEERGNPAALYLLAPNKVGSEPAKAVFRLDGLVDFDPDTSGHYQLFTPETAELAQVWQVTTRNGSGGGGMIPISESVNARGAVPKSTSFAFVLSGNDNTSKYVDLLNRANQSAVDDGRDAPFVPPTSPEQHSALAATNEAVHSALAKGGYDVSNAGDRLGVFADEEVFSGFPVELPRVSVHEYLSDAASMHSPGGDVEFAKLARMSVGRKDFSKVARTLANPSTRPGVLNIHRYAYSIEKFNHSVKTVLSQHADGRWQRYQNSMFDAAEVGESRGRVLNSIATENEFLKTANDRGDTVRSARHGEAITSLEQQISGLNEQLTEHLASALGLLTASDISAVKAMHLGGALKIGAVISKKTSNLGFGAPGK